VDCGRCPGLASGRSGSKDRAGWAVWRAKPKTEWHGLGIGLGCANAPVSGAGALWATVDALGRLVGGRGPKIAQDRRFWP
jgi:hypothetical protein